MCLITLEECLPVYWCSIILFIDSNKDSSSVWFVSLARRNAGADIEANNWINFTLEAEDKFFT
jgi:hypothetical protein